MPYVKSISVRSTVNKTLSYILNPDKTEQLLYTSSMNCMTSAQDAYLEMKSVFEHYSSDKYNAPPPLEGKGTVKAIHYIQSFDPKDNIAPELAHRIGKAFARKTFGDDCQVVIATHVDKNHVHNHILVNTYTMSGRKLNNNQTTLKQARDYSDSTCLAFGVQPYDKSKGKGKTVAYNEWDNRKHGTSWKQKIQLEIDSLIDSVKNVDELLYELEMKGYEVKKGKYISLKAPGQKRFVRTKTLGEDYTVDSLASRILWRDVGSHAPLNDDPSPLRECYQVIIGQVTQLVVENKKVQRRRDHNAPYSSTNDLDVHRLSAQLTIINRDNLHSIEEVDWKIESLKTDYEKIRGEINQLSEEHEHLSSLISQAELYFSLKDKSDLSDMEQLRLTVSRQSMENNNITSADQIGYLKQTLRNLNEKQAALKEDFNRCQQLYAVYSDIAKTYREIAKGDYISNLVQEKQKEEETQKRQVVKR